MKNYHAILFFNTEINLGLGIRPDVWVNHKTLNYTNGAEAFINFIKLLKMSSDKVYLISGETPEELEEARRETLGYFADPKWREKYL